MYPSMFYRFVEHIKTVTYTSDEGAVVEDFRSWTMHGRDPITSSMEVALTSSVVTPGTFTGYTIWLNENILEKYKRTYPKLQSVLANVGGIIKFIMTISNFITTYITSQMLDVEMSNYFISDDDNKDFRKRTIKKTCSSSPSKSQSEVLNFTTSVSGSPRHPKKMHVNVNLLNYLHSDKKFNRSLSFKEAVLPSCCVNKKSSKHQINGFSEIIRSRISLDHLLVVFRDFENLKNLLLNEEKKKELANMKSPTLKEYLGLNNEKDLNSSSTRTNSQKVMETAKSTRRNTNDILKN